MKAAKQCIHIIIALLLLIVVKLVVPAENGLTEVGVNVLAVLAPILYLWIAVGTDWTSLLALAAIICTGVLTPTVVQVEFPSLDSITTRTLDAVA